VNTPRTIRLIRADGLPAMHRALSVLAGAGALANVRGRVVLVPSRAAAYLLRQTLEELCFRHVAESEDAALALPDVLARDDWYQRMHERAGFPERRLTRLEREVILGAAARDAIDAGAVPPFRLRPGLIAEMLAFYDELDCRQRTIDAFERNVSAQLERDADLDRGARRLLDQTRFLAAAFRAFESRVAATGALDEAGLRRRLLMPDASPGVSHVIVAVGDRTAEPSGGLAPADFDLMTRMPGVVAIDILATERQLASGLHERLHNLVPDLEETEAAWLPASTRLEAPADESERLHFTSRDREEELRAVVRRIKAAARRPGPPRALARTAVVFKRPLPYVYLATTVFEAAGVEYQAADAVPLAAEPMAAVLDLVCDAVESHFSRATVLALLRSPHLAADPSDEPPPAADVDAFDRGLVEARYLGDLRTLASLAARWSGSGAAAARAAATLAAALGPFDVVDRVSVHASRLLDFLRTHERMVFHDDALRSRHLRARGAVLSALEELRQAALAFDDPPTRFGDVAATVRRWIESQTFSPRLGARGVHLADAQAARFGAFDVVHLVGLAEGDWPERPSRNIFYPAFLLSDLGWPAQADQQAAVRAAFLDLLTLPRDRVSVSSFTLEDDSIVGPSPLIDEIPRARLEVDRPESPRALVFTDEALSAILPVDAARSPAASAWLARRRDRSAATRAEFHGEAGPVDSTVYAVTAIDRFLECPFKYFAHTVLRLPEDVDDEPTMTPRAEGEFVHGVLRAFFDAWQSAGFGAIAPELLPEARRRFAAVAEQALTTLPASEAAIQRTRLLGGVGARGLGEIVLAAEAERPEAVRERLLEYELNGEFTISAGGESRTVRLRGKADRVDLLADGRFRLIDYKNGSAPERVRTIQLPVYTVCVRQQLQRTRGEQREPAEAGYLAFGERKPVRVVVDDGDKGAEALADGQQRLLDAIDRIERGSFPPRPFAARICGYCPYSTVCRKDYVDGE
jgi:ATP-dependent helicase/nuclease subunit B